jgi:fatty acid desaturase
MTASVAGRVSRIPRPEEPVPGLAWPTISLLVLGLGAGAASCTLYLTGSWPWWPATIVNGLVMYWCFFTVWHEASHQAVSTSEAVNTWLGRIAFFLIVPWAGYRFVRFVHMQHHRFTGVQGLDPDYGVNHGRWWTTPLRWASLDLIGAGLYLRRLRARPVQEKREQAATVMLFAGLATPTIATGHGVALLVLVIAPQRLAMLQMGLIFDWLPHHGLRSATAPPDQFDATRNRVGWERLMTPLTLYQNYHLVHHLHPTIPFYRYISVWRRNEDRYLQHEPLMSTWAGRPVTTEEYRRLRELERHE